MVLSVLPEPSDVSLPCAGHTKIELLKVVDVIEWSGGLIKSLRAYKG